MVASLKLDRLMSEIPIALVKNATGLDLILGVLRRALVIVRELKVMPVGYVERENVEDAQNEIIN